MAYYRADRRKRFVDQPQYVWLSTSLCFFAHLLVNTVPVFINHFLYWLLFKCQLDRKRNNTTLTCKWTLLSSGVEMLYFCFDPDFLKISISSTLRHGNCFIYGASMYNHDHYLNMVCVTCLSSVVVTPVVGCWSDWSYKEGFIWNGVSTTAIYILNCMKKIINGRDELWWHVHDTCTYKYIYYIHVINYMYMYIYMLSRSYDIL